MKVVQIVLIALLMFRAHGPVRAQTPSAGAAAQPAVHPATAAAAIAFTKAGHGAAILLIPGLYCSWDVWQGTVAHLKDRYTCYSITLPGFAGQPPAPMSDSLLDGFAQAIIAL